MSEASPRSLIAMPESFIDRQRRRALCLVLEKDRTPSQAAKILQCTVRAVKRWIEEYLDHEAVLADTPTDPASFLPVVIDESDDGSEELVAEPIPLDILTRSGLTLRLQLSSVNDVAALLRSLEVDRC